jgi:peroxiredoxin family protein
VKKPLVIYLHSDAFDRTYLAVNMIRTAASTGRKCYLFLFYHALGSFVSGAWDDMRISKSAGLRGSETGETSWESKLEHSFELANLPSVYDLLERAREEGGEVAVYACSNSTQYLGLDPADVGRRVDGIVGLATMLDISSGDCQVMYM